MDIPEDLYYSDDHLWVQFESDIATIGVTDYAQNELMDIVFVEIPEIGAEIEQGDSFGSIEALKTVAPLISPVSGEILEVNESLEHDPKQINNDPYGDGWLVRVQIHDLEELESLMISEDYRMNIDHYE